MITTFWRWFFWGVPGGRQGWRVLVRWSLLFHASVAALMLALLKAAPIEFAGKALFPAASILVSMAVAWTSRAATILQDSDFRSKIVGEENPIEDYVYGYQLSLLIIIIMVSYISIMASGGCLGTERRRRTWLPAISRGLLEASSPADFRMGKPY